MLEKLQKLNPKLSLFSVASEKFRPYGRVLQGFAFEEIHDYMEKISQIPAEGNVYHASIAEMEKTELYTQLSETLYGQMPIQIGYCNGNNHSLNGLEYHKGNEINYASTDLVLLLGHIWQIEKNHFHSKNIIGFYLPKGTAIEVYTTTLHFAPCKITDSGFKCLVVLPAGTNTPLIENQKQFTEEDELLFMRNKWLIAHPQADRLVKNGAYVGIEGENYTLIYK